MSDAEKLRDQAAKPVLKRINNDHERVSEQLKPALALIEKKLFDQNLNINALWLETGLRKTSASPRFSEELGVTPGVYLTDCRMRVAAELLSTTTLKVRHITGLVGYSKNHSGFANMFKAWSQQIPTDYRLAHQGNDDVECELTPGPPWASTVPQLLESVGGADAADDMDRARQGLARAEVIFLDRQIQDLRAPGPGPA